MTENMIEINLKDLLHCPKCGVLLTKENFHRTVDESTDDEYRWIKCACGWNTDG